MSALEKHSSVVIGLPTGTHRGIILSHTIIELFCLTYLVNLFPVLTNPQNFLNTSLTWVNLTIVSLTTLFRDFLLYPSCSQNVSSKKHQYLLMLLRSIHHRPICGFPLSGLPLGWHFISQATFDM